jgi:hypothetical protein
VQTFRASRKCELDLVLAKTDHLQAILDSAENVAKVRDRIRFRGVLVALVFLIGIALIMALFPELHLNGPTVMGVPTCVIFWSAVGSFASMLYRFTHAWDGELEDPVRWLFSRPLTGIVMGSIAYLILKAGLVAVAQQSPAASGNSANTTEVMWLIAFLAGFSDRFSHTLLRSLAGRFGGNTETEFATSTTHRERRRVDDTQLDGTSASVEVETTEVKVAAAGQSK